MLNRKKGNHFLYEFFEAGKTVFDLTNCEITTLLKSDYLTSGQYNMVQYEMIRRMTDATNRKA